MNAREMDRIEAQLDVALWRARAMRDAANFRRLEATTVGGLSKQDRALLKGSAL